MENRKEENNESSKKQHDLQIGKNSKETSDDKVNILISTYKYAGIEFSEAQAGGHPGTIIHKVDRVLKKAKNSEMEFYEYLNSERVSQELKEIKYFLPKYFGLEILNGNKYLALENLHTGYEHANVMDLKLGKTTWRKNAPVEKILSQQRKNNLISTCANFGFRVTGLVLYDHNGNIIESLKKPEVEIRITQDNISEYFKRLISYNGELQKHFLNQIINDTEKILAFFKNQNEKTFIASSIYYVIGKNNKMQVRYIDVAHPEDSEGKNDDNVIEGIEGILKFWRQIYSLQ